MQRKTIVGVLFASVLALILGCSQNQSNQPNSASVHDQVSQALQNAGFKDISVDVSTDKEVVTLSGDVKTQDEKDRVAQVAKGAAGSYVISNEVGIRPNGQESQANDVDKNVDSAIEKDYKAVLIANRLDSQHIRYASKNGVLTLKGKVDNSGVRQEAEKLAAGVPNVQQVVNELDVKGGRRASVTSGNGSI